MDIKFQTCPSLSERIYSRHVVSSRPLASAQHRKSQMTHPVTGNGIPGFSTPLKRTNTADTRDANQKQKRQGTHGGSYWHARYVRGLPDGVVQSAVAHPSFSDDFHRIWVACPPYWSTESVWISLTSEDVHRHNHRAPSRRNANRKSEPRQQG